MQSLSDTDLSNEAFPFRCAKEISLGFAKLLLIRITYMGELGYELYIPTCPLDSSAPVVRGTAERWILRNSGEDWAHPVHIHLEEHQIVSRSGRATTDDERLLIETSRKDVSVIDPGEELEIFLRFRDWTGRYPIHCHNTVHEDHAMMLRWEVVDP